MSRKAYIARYPLRPDGKDLEEQIIYEDTYCSPALFAKWDELVAARQSPKEPMLQMWYSDSEQVLYMARTNQPFKLD